MKKAVVIHQDLLTLQEWIQTHSNTPVSALEPEKESLEYGACTFIIGKQIVKFRSAKITPNKAGAFVTLWKRIEDGSICPFDASDEIDLSVITTRNGAQFGLFVFPRSVLLDKHILSGEGKAGKRGFRVYPPWSGELNKQAERTQSWQLDFFVQLEGKRINLDKAERLFFKAITNA